MTSEFEGRVALVTGSATGLGRSIAVKLAERGAAVIVNYSRSKTEAEETAALIEAASAKAVIVRADVSTEEGCARLRDAAATFGRLDMLANNAGITKHASDHGDLDALGRDDFMSIYAVNVVGPFLALQALKPLLLAAHEASGRASAVVNSSSIAGTTGVGSSVAYAASKGALNTMTLSLARGLAPAIRVNAICPGFIGTRWFRDAMDKAAYEKTVRKVEATTPLAAASGPDDIADAALFLLSDAARHVTGELLHVDAGIHLGFAPLKAR
ncbi:MAG: SDR family NAD(P)-dependent oxidoreductase [Pikeienuella sp.]